MARNEMLKIKQIEGLSALLGFSGYSGFSGFDGLTTVAYSSLFNAGSDWTLSGGSYYIDFTHSLNTYNIAVELWDLTTGVPTFSLAQMEEISYDVLRISVPAIPDARFAGRVVINGSAASGWSGFSGNSTSGFSGGSGISGFSGVSGYSGVSATIGAKEIAFGATDGSITSDSLFKIFPGTGGGYTQLGYVNIGYSTTAIPSTYGIDMGAFGQARISNSNNYHEFDRTSTDVFGNQTFGISGAERMRLTYTDLKLTEANLKIYDALGSNGTYSPTTIQWNGTTYTTILYNRIGDSNFSNPFGNGAVDFSTNSTAGMLIGTTTNSSLGFGTNNVMRLKIDSAGAIYTSDIVIRPAVGGGYSDTIQMPSFGRIFTTGNLFVDGGENVVVNGQYFGSSGSNIFTNKTRIGAFGTPTYLLELASTASNQVTFSIDGLNGLYVQSNIGGSPLWSQLSMGADRIRIITHAGSPTLITTTYEDLSITPGAGSNKLSITASDLALNIPAIDTATGVLYMKNGNVVSTQMHFQDNFAGQYWLDIATYMQIGYIGGYVRWTGTGATSMKIAQRSNEITLEDTSGIYLNDGGGDTKVRSLTGTGDRMVQSNSTGNLSANTEIVNAWISDATQISILTAGANWGVGGIWITPSPTLSTTYQGQMYYDGSYFYIMVADNTPIRLTRG